MVSGGSAGSGGHVFLVVSVLQTVSMARLPSVVAALLALWMPCLRGFRPAPLQRHRRPTGSLDPRLPSRAPVHHRGAAAAAATAAAPRALLEVELKFHLAGRDPDALRDRLRALGGAPRGAVRMVDWYFDAPGHPLVRQDCWLRFRQRRAAGPAGDDDDDHSAADTGGDWELKRGRRRDDRDGGERGTTTVYEETAGLRGFDLAVSLLPPSDESAAAAAATPREDWAGGGDVPALPRPDTGLAPFARIVTTRTSWTVAAGPAPTDTAVSVDLDTTEDGHAVGEIETVVAAEAQVPRARARLQEFRDRLLGGGAGAAAAAKGKLEAYIEKHRPELYRILCEEGIM